MKIKKKEKKIEEKNDKKEFSIIDKNMILFTIVLINIFFNTQILIGGFSMLYYIEIIIINFLLIVSLFIIFTSLTKKIKTSLLITNIIIFIIAIIDYFLVEIRQVPLFFSDFFSLRTVINVADKYTVNFKWYFFLGIADFILNIFLISKLNFEKEMEARVKRRYSLFGFIIIIIIWSISSPQMYFETNLSDNTYGVIYRFLKTTKNTFTKKPENYSKQRVEEILAKYKKNEEETNEDKPNVIVIMNESLADLNSVYNLGYNDNLNFINSLSRNTKVYSAGYAGGTANSEFEFLTGISASFYGRNIPYQQYIRDDIFSFPRVMKENGYKASAMHLYFSSSYNRKEIYDYMGFDETIFDDDAQTLIVQKRLRTDKNVYNEIINMFENKKEDEKLFHFCITLQNHMPYNMEFNYKKDNEEIKEIDENFKKEYPNKHYTDNEQLNYYLNLEKMSDEAFEELVKYFENYNEKVIILIFGDHQPYIQDEKLETEDAFSKCFVSYALWSNYDIGEYDIKETSINYLPVILSDIIGLKDSEYFEFLKELRKKIPVIVAGVYKDIEGNWYYVEDKNSKYYDLINQYDCIQYYLMHEKTVE